jgi:asparagine synthase (glutamine-hydrolysing)
MSAVAAAIRTNGGPVAHGTIERLIAACAPAASLSCGIWCEGQAALGQAAPIDVTSVVPPKPVTLDGSDWIVADARIDDRETLAAALGVRSAANAPAAELILRAFAKWGSRCVEYLIGDFAFVIWTPRTRSLFCVRDHLGIKPLHYVASRKWLLVASGVNGLRQHPAVSDTLDDTAVADFLLFGHKADRSSTTFRDIRRLPPAHVLMWTANQGCRIQPYWALPIDAPVYRRRPEYSEELRALLTRAVTDRLGTGRVGIFFSGGIDSTTVAAVARASVSAALENPVRAFSFVYESVAEDNERQYAAAAAAHLGIPCHVFDATAAPGWGEENAPVTPEPLVESLHPVVRQRCFNEMAAHSALAFSGEGPDNALIYEWRSYLWHVWRTKQFGRLTSDAATYLLNRRRLPRWSSLFARGHAELTNGPSEPPIPEWLSPDLVRNLHLKDRWRFVMRPPISKHPIRPAAYFSFDIPLWDSVFDGWHPSYTGAPLEIRHPYLDLRIVRFLLALPVIPWCRDKHILRCAFSNDLPSVIRRRPKTPLPASIDLARIRRDGMPTVVRSCGLDAYAPASRLKALSIDDPVQAEAFVRLATFSRWLARLDTARAAAASH